MSLSRPLTKWNQNKIANYKVLKTYYQKEVRLTTMKSILKQCQTSAQMVSFSLTLISYKIYSLAKTSLKSACFTKTKTRLTK